MFHDVTIDNRKFLLWLVTPNWGQKIQVSIHWPREVVESLNRHEYRYLQGSPEVALKATFLLSAEQYSNLRDFLGNTYFGDGSMDSTPMHDRLIAMPFWPDWGDYYWSGENYFDSGHWIAFEDGVSFELSSSPGGDFTHGSRIAPLGFFSFSPNPRVRGIARELYEVTCSFEPVLSGGLIPKGEPSPIFPAILTPNWQENVIEQDDDSLEHRFLGRSRVPQKEGDEGFSRMVQTAGFLLSERQEIQTLLGFLHGASVGSFDLPLWNPPNESATLNKPHGLRARLDESPVVLNFETSDIATTTITFLQDLWNADGMIAPNWFLSLTRDDEEKYFCDFESDLGGWQSIPLEIDLTSEGLESKATVKLGREIGEALFANDLTLRLPVSVILLTGYGATPVSWVFKGQLTKLNAESSFYELTCQTHPGKQIPSAYFSRVDNKGIFEEGRADPNAYRVSLTLPSASGATLPVSLPATTVLDPNNQPADLYAGGTAKFGSGWSAQLRRIVSSTAESITLDQPVEFTGGISLKILPGYFGSYWEAERKFAQKSSFMAFPFIPEHLNELPYKAPRTGK